MRKLLNTLLLLLASLVFITPAQAQVVSPGFVDYVTSAPAGACSQGAHQQNVLGSGNIYTCQSGTWHIAGGSGLGCAEGTCLVNAPTADQTVTGAHGLILSDSGSHIDSRGYIVGGSPFSSFTGSFLGLRAADPAGGGIGISGQQHSVGGYGLQAVSQGAGASGLSASAQSSDNTDGAIGVTGYAESVTTTNANLVSIGAYGLGYVSPSVATTVTAAAGVTGAAINEGAGVVTTLESFRAQGNANSGAGTVTANYAYDAPVKMLTNGAGATNGVLHAVDQGAGANDYGIVFEGSTHNNLGGGVTVVGNLLDSGLTASVPVLTDSSKNLVSGTQTGTGTVFAMQTAPAFLTSITTPILLTTTKCAAAGSAANPSVAACSAAPSGSFSCATNASAASCTVNTTAVTAASAIFVQPDSSLGTLLSVTCNTSADTGLVVPRVSARSAGTSFTIATGTFATNPICFNYWVVN